MRKKTMNLLVQLGVPVNLIGFHYICDAMEIYEKDETHLTSKICQLYSEIAQKHNASASNVERCISLISVYLKERWRNVNSNRFGCTKECKDRHPGCHGSCEKYHEAKQKYLDGQCEISKKRYHDANYKAAHRDAVRRCLRSR